MKLRELYIIGPPRSGTTLLAHLVGGGQSVLSFSEPYLCYSIMPPWQLNRFFYRFEKSAGLQRRRPPFRGDAQQFAGFLRRLASDNGFRYLAVKETYRYKGLTPIWHNGPLLDRVVAGTDPVVALIRHPYDIAASTIKLCRWVIGLPGRIIRLRLPNLCGFSSATEVVRWAADNWVAYVNWARRHGLNLLRYEDFVADPRRELQAICTAVGWPFAESMLDGQRRRAAFGGLGDLGVLMKPRPVDRKSVGHGQRLNDAQRHIVREACHALAHEFDYTLDETPARVRGGHDAIGITTMLGALARRLTPRPVRPH